MVEVECQVWCFMCDGVCGDITVDCDYCDGYKDVFIADDIKGQWEVDLWSDGVRKR